MRLQLDFTGTHESEQRDFSLPPVGEYPCIMLVEGYKKDAGGELMTGLDGQPVLLTTGKGNPMWNLRNTIVDGPHLGKIIFDGIYFSEKAMQRAAVIFVRAGMMASDKECQANPKLLAQRKRKFEPDELNETFWWVTVHHEVARNADGSMRAGKYPFKAKGCACEACHTAAQAEQQAIDAGGAHPMVNAKPDFDGYRVMSPAETKKYRPLWVAYQLAETEKANGTAADATAAVGDDEDVPF